MTRPNSFDVVKTKGTRLQLLSSNISLSPECHANVCTF